MSKESNFLIYCMERYRHFKGLSGADVAKTFEEYGIYGYITKYFESKLRVVVVVKPPTVVFSVN